MGNLHAVSGCKVSVHQLVFSEVLHSFSNLKAHVNHPFLCFTDLCVCVHIRKSRGVERRAGSFKLWLHHWQCEEGKVIEAVTMYSSYDIYRQHKP